MSEEAISPSINKLHLNGDNSGNSSKSNNNKKLQTTKTTEESNKINAEEKRNNDKDDVLEHQSIRKLVAPLSKEQLVELVAKATCQYPILMENIKSMVQNSPSCRRLMIRNIPFSTKDRDFIQMFASFGNVDDATIVREKNGRSKGYGFVTYSDLNSVDKALQTKLSLDGRQLLIKLAGDPFSDFTSGGVVESALTGSSVMSRKKLFLRNLSDMTGKEELIQAFQDFGPVEEAVIITDAQNRSRGYGFITFYNTEDAIKALQVPQKIINGKVVFISFAAPTKSKFNYNDSNSYLPYTNTRRSSKDDNYSRMIPPPGATAATPYPTPVSNAAYTTPAYPSILPAAFYSQPAPYQAAHYGQQAFLPLPTYASYTNPATGLDIPRDEHRRY